MGLPLFGEIFYYFSFDFVFLYHCFYSIIVILLLNYYLKNIFVLFCYVLRINIQKYDNISIQFFDHFSSPLHYYPSPTLPTSPLPSPPLLSPPSSPSPPPPPPPPKKRHIEGGACRCGNLWSNSPLGEKLDVKASVCWDLRTLFLNDGVFLVDFCVRFCSGSGFFFFFLIFFGFGFWFCGFGSSFL